jgi:hypothetical protein
VDEVDIPVAEFPVTASVTEGLTTELTVAVPSCAQAFDINNNKANVINFSIMCLSPLKMFTFYRRSPGVIQGKTL